MNGDVRMRGFETRHDVDEVVRLIEARIAALTAEPLAIADAAGRVLAEDVTADRDVPSFDRSAMDGYALSGEETFGATVYQPLPFRVIGDSRPARPFDGTVGRGEAVRIMTGAPMPSGADAVLMAESTRPDGDGILAVDAVAPEKNVGRRGEDVRAGEVVVRRGRVLRPQDLGVIASIGVATIAVVRRPRVALLVTGDELIDVAAPPKEYHVVDSNSLVLRALIERDGGRAAGAARIPDDREALGRALAESEADVILVSGGSSVGVEDHAPTLVAELGELAVHGVALRPAGPTGLGFVFGRPVFLMPGNPVSCLCAYDFFAGPAIRRLGGRSMEWPHRRAVLPVGRKIISAIGRVDYVRVSISDGRVAPIATTGASILSSTTRADGVVVVAKEREGFGVGETVEVRLYDA